MIRDQQILTKVRIATGLNEVDGIGQSSHFIEYIMTDTLHNLEQIERNITRYWSGKNHDEHKEADFIALNIIRVLDWQNFELSSKFLCDIHRQLFKNVWLLDGDAGKYRSCNITKKEPLLDNDTVVYADFIKISEQLEAVIRAEKKNRYKNKEENVFKLAEFAYNIWKIHPFIEGNTRTLALFLYHYTKSMRIPFDMRIFMRHTVLFRDSFVMYDYAKTWHNADPDKKNFLHNFFRCAMCYDYESDYNNALPLKNLRQ